MAWSSLPAVVFGVATHAGMVGRAVQLAARTVRPMPPLPAAIPLERIAAHLRRLAGGLAEFGSPGASVPVAKRLAVHRAYEDRLADACAALEIPHRLGAVSGWEHAFELARVDCALVDAGLAFTPPMMPGRGGP